LMQAKGDASHALEAVKRLERGMLSESSNNATHHAQTKQLFRTCAEAGHSLMEALQAALAAHEAAEVKAVAMAEAKDTLEASSQKFAASLGSFQKVLAQHQDIALTYKSPRADFDKLISLANSLPSMADEAVRDEAEQTAKEQAEATATVAYQQAHAATVLTDDKVAAAHVVQEKACEGLGLLPPVETKASEPYVYLGGGKCQDGKGKSFDTVYQHASKNGWSLSHCRDLCSQIGSNCKGVKWDETNCQFWRSNAEPWNQSAWNVLGTCWPPTMSVGCWRRLSWFNANQGSTYEIAGDGPVMTAKGNTPRDASGCYAKNFGQQFEKKANR